MAVIGFDDILDARSLSPSLTTIRHPTFSLGYQSVITLLDHIRGDTDRTERVVVTPRLIIRQSCGCQTNQRSFASPSTNSIEVALQVQDLSRAMAEASMIEARNSLFEDLYAQCNSFLNAFLESLKNQDAQVILQEVKRVLTWTDEHDEDPHIWQTGLAVLSQRAAAFLEIIPQTGQQDIKLLVDFHYSDNWADPGKQVKPAAWMNYDFEQLKKAVYDHTFDVCSSLVAQGTPPDMVQVGNEINAGMLWPDGHTYDPPNWDNLAQLLIAGSNAVKACSPETQVILHIAEGGDNELARWWFDNITSRNVPFDVIGVSYYPSWHGSLGELQYNLNDISARYDKDVIVVETAYAFSDRDHDDYPNIVIPI